MADKQEVDHQCDKRSCLVKLTYKGVDSVSMFDDEKRTKPARYDCSCQAKMAIAKTIAQLYGEYYLGLGDPTVVFAALDLRVVFIDEDTTPDVPVESTEQAAGLLSKFRGVA